MSILFLALLGCTDMGAGKATGEVESSDVEGLLPSGDSGAEPGADGGAGGGDWGAEGGVVGADGSSPGRDEDGDGAVALEDGGEDCDDSDATIYPGADELCDGVDQDCDGELDDDPVDGETWWADADGDGFGDPEAALRACREPAGVEDNAEDCDDTDRDVNPVSRELCNDGKDNDCDGTANDCSLAGTFSGPTADVRLLGASENDRAGYSATTVSDFDGDGRAELAIGAPQAGVSNQGAVYLVEDFEDGTLTMSDSAGLRFLGAGSGDRAGWRVAATTDLNGDGRGELLISSQSSDEGADNAGSVFLFYGDSSLTGDVSLAEADAVIPGLAANVQLGSAITPIADFTGDGQTDLLLGAWMWTTASGPAGGAWVVEGPVGGDMDLDEAYLYVEGDEVNDRAGAAAGTADLNGDGLGDVLLGAPDTSNLDPGEIAIYFGGYRGSLAWGAADVRVQGVADGDRFGTSLAMLGDLDGDGQDEFAVGAQGYDGTGGSSGAVWIWNGLPADGSTAASAMLRLDGESGGDLFGRSVVTAGDVNGDDEPDLLVGAPGAGSLGGRAYLFYGPIDSSGTAAGAGAIFEADSSDDDSADPLVPGLDLHNDGYADIILGAPGDGTGGRESGSVFIFRGMGM